MANAGLPSHAVAPLCSIIRILYRPRRRERRRAVAVSPSGGAVPEPPPILLPLDRLALDNLLLRLNSFGPLGRQELILCRGLFPGNRVVYYREERERARSMARLPPWYGMVPLLKIWAIATIPWICHG